MMSEAKDITKEILEKEPGLTLSHIINFLLKVEEGREFTYETINYKITLKKVKLDVKK